MWAKLDAVEARYDELTRQLSDPATVQNQKLFRDLSKEHQEVGKVTEVYRALKKIRQQISDNKELIAKESDKEFIDMAQSEINELQPQAEKLQEDLKVLLLPKDPNDEKNVILEIRSGAGGDEAALFAGELFRMYARYAETHGWKVEIMSSSPGAQGGVKEVIVFLSGSGVYSNLKWEAGVHRVQRVPDTETQGRVHTSVVTVAVLPEAEEVEVDIQEKDLRIDVYRSGGPGGQSVNTTDSAVRVTHLPTGLVVACQDEKSQIKNKAKALKILRARLLEKYQAEQDAKITAERRAMVKSGERSDKIRTYNFPQDRMTDHRIGFTVHNLPKILQGDLDDIIVALRTHYQAEALKSGLTAN